MDDPTIGLAERLLALLDQASVTTTYKYAVLLALLDAVMETSDASGTPADRVEVVALADHVLAAYWPHTDPYPGTGAVLRQSGSGQAEILTAIAAFRSVDPAARPTLAAARYAPGFDRLLRTTSWKLAEMPLPRLQRVGTSVDPFLYELEWDESIKRADFERADFDRSIRLRPGVARELARLAPLVRPLVERLWSGRVVTFNRLPDRHVDDFLFRRARLDALRVRAALVELQDGRCFYTGEPLSGGRGDVDHFVPWSRSPLNAIENLVVAAPRANNSKRDHLAAAHLVERWRDRNEHLDGDLRAIAVANRWETAADASLGVARALYRSLTPSNLLWAAPGMFVPTDVAILDAALGDR